MTQQRILIADDEEVILRTLAAIFTKEGFDVKTARSGQEALNLIQRWQPHFFLSDVVMPGMTGIEAAILLRRLCPDCRILLISGQAVTAELLGAARKQGHTFDVVAKPIHPTELLAVIRGPGSPRSSSSL